ncbi:MAG: LUD domain-containing protein [Phycisphaerales bacterium]|nr:LUD domain-containing protein [Phycisphaerales bacterium]
MTTREDILARIRGHIDASGVSPRPTEPVAVRTLGNVTQDDLVEEFAQQLEGVAGCCHRVGTLDEAVTVLAKIIAESGEGMLARSSETRVIDLVEQAAGAWEVATEQSPREVLLDCAIGVTTASWGIAEHGTIVMPSGDADLDRERTRLVALLPLVHVAILRASDLVGTISEAIARVSSHGVGDRPLPPTVTFATGPSRTADIQQELVLGVHGPHAQHVILLTAE